MEIWDDYFDKITKDQHKILLKMLKIAMKEQPDAVAEMPYGVPGLKLNGKGLIAVAAHTNHYGVYPMSPKVIKSVEHLLDGQKTAKGTIQFSYDEFPTNELIKEIIIRRSQEIL